eukprot:Selendium_serpulae@DN7594_c0_g1_i1.p1
MDSVCFTLGYRHWATIMMLDNENRVSNSALRHTNRDTHRITHRKGCADKMVENNDFIWRYCVESHSLPAASYNSFGFLVEELLGAGFPVPPRILLRTLACHSLMFTGDASLEGAAGRTLSQCGMPIRG